MDNKPVLLCFTAALYVCLPMHALSSPYKEPDITPKTDALNRSIEQQQRDIDSQQTQLDRQKQELHQLRQQLQEITGTGDNPVAHTSHNIPARRNDLQTNRRDDAQPVDSWKGSFAIKDAETRIRIGGFIQLDIIHDTNAIDSKGQFIPGTIKTRNITIKDGSEGQTNFSVSPSRFFIETRTPVDNKRVKTFLSIDMYGDELGVDPELRLRQAYVELDDSLFGGNLLIGQAWSTTTDLESTPDVLDFRGADSLFGSLLPQVRWTRPIADGTRIMLALETPANHIIEGADVITRLPDGVIATSWDNTSFNLMASLLVTDLRASFNNGPVESAVGYGINLSGKIKLPFGAHENDFMFSVTSGKGIGSHYQNATADAVYDNSSASLKPIATYGVTLAYTHGWNARLRSTLTYCCINITNDHAQSPDSLRETEYSSGNLVWDVSRHWIVGIEGIWGKRKDHDDTRATDFRTQFTSRYSF